MLKIEQLLIQDVKPGDVLAHDIFVDHKLLMKKDSILTEKGLELLKKKNVKFISIYYDEKPTVSVDFPSVESSRKVSQPIESIVFNFSNNLPNENVDAFNLYGLLDELDMGIRYGKLLNDKSAIVYLENLIQSIIANSTYNNYLLQLKNWDYQSYLHCLDTFIFGTLFARHLKVEQIEQLAVGYLLHDIGKIKIPQKLLQKTGRLTAKEFELMKAHTLHGEAIFNEIGLNHLSYIAKSHHERRDGEGYPDSSAKLYTLELELLQIIDVYSAITMKRPYRDAMRAADAFSLLFRDEEKFNSDLLTKFVDFIGIYPENSIVLLSDGLHGIVEKANAQYPTSPRVKCMETNRSFHILVNSDISILKMISYQTEDQTELLNTFYNELVSANIDSAKKTYLKIVDNFKVSEYFTKIFVPVYRILNLLKQQNAIYDKKYTQVVEYMEQLMQQKIDEQIENDLYQENVLILVDDHFKNDYFFKVFLGLIHNNRIFPHIISLNSNLEHILAKLDSTDFSKTCVITSNNTNTLLLSYLPNVSEVPQSKIEQYLIDLIGDNKDSFNFHYLLERLAVSPPIFI